jgi:hypothetical protein
MKRISAHLLLGAALLLHLQAQAQAQPPDAARTFVKGLYDAYQHSDPAYLGVQAPTTFAPHLLALIRHDQATTPLGDAPDLDWDPICACQDDGGMKVGRIEIRAMGPGRKTATATLRYLTDVVTVKLDLVSVHGRWRVADIHTKDAPSLVVFLEDSARRDEAQAKSHR